MTKFKVDSKTDHLIGVVCPKHKGNYGIILPAVIKAIDKVVYESQINKKSFTFIHDGVTSGSTSEVIEALNKTQNSLQSYGYEVHHRKLALDIELHGRQSHYRWIDDVLGLNLALLLVFDDEQTHFVKYAIREAEKEDVKISVTKINKTKEE